MSIIAVGDADMEEIKDLIHGVFGDMKPIQDVAARIPTPVPAHENLLVSVVDDEEATQSTFSLYFKSDPVPIRMESDYRGQLVQQLLVYMLNQRFDELRRKPKPNNPVAGISNLFRRDSVERIIRERDQK